MSATFRGHYLSDKLRYFTSVAKEVAREKGIIPVLRGGFKVGVDWLSDLILCYYFKATRRHRIFAFQGADYRYLLHIYSDTWKNERTVEIPIIWDIVKKNCGKKILEVGNVLSHYFAVDHEVIDKYEKAIGVMNVDVVDFEPQNKYDLIVSISTLEHVGADEKPIYMPALAPGGRFGQDQPRNAMKIARAVENLKRCLAPGGKIAVTLPIGQNPEMDRLLEEGVIAFSRLHFLRRISKDNLWVETNDNNILWTKYNSPFPGANAVTIGIYERG
jgi:SAM-dependent methyltransferase